MVVCLAGAAAVTAAEGEPPCLADVQRLCSRVPPNGGFVQGCLQAHLDGLSAKCRKHVGDFARDTETLTTACQRELDGLCARIPTATGDRVSCLVAHRDTLSPKCRETLESQAAE